MSTRIRIPRKLKKRLKALGFYTPFCRKHPIYGYIFSTQRSG